MLVTTQQWPWNKLNLTTKVDYNIFINDYDGDRTYRDPRTLRNGTLINKKFAHDKKTLYFLGSDTDLNSKLYAVKVLTALKIPS